MEASFFFFKQPVSFWLEIEQEMMKHLQNQKENGERESEKVKEENVTPNPPTSRHI